MSESKEVKINELTEKARKTFQELEDLVKMHRAANRIPTLGAADIHSAALNLLDLMTDINRIDFGDAPKLDVNLD